MTEEIEIEIIPEGKHSGVIREFYAPKELRTHPSGHWHVRLKIELTDVPGSRFVYVHESGYFDTMLMVWESREYWIGRTVGIGVKHRTYKGMTHATAHVRNWKPQGS